MKRFLLVPLLALIAAGGPSCAIAEPGSDERGAYATVAPHAHGEAASVSTRDPGEDDDAATFALRREAGKVFGLWRSGALAAAAAKIASTPHMAVWDRCPGISLEARYRDDGVDGRLGVTVRRDDADEPLAVAFDPGLYGASPRVQHLPLLRPAMLVLAPGEREGRLDFPIACASFHLEGPDRGCEYRLARYAPGSAMHRLTTWLCSGEPWRPELVQVAVWVVANRITRPDLVAMSLARHRIVTFESHERISFGGLGAEEILWRAGFDPTSERFFSPTPDDEALEDDMLDRYNRDWPIAVPTPKTRA